VSATREHRDIILGASPRSGIIFLKCLRAYALVNKRGFVTEDDIFRLAEPVLNHRLIFRNKETKETSLKNIVHKEISRLSKLNLHSD
jgi:MoxR-like ATPase